MEEAILARYGLLGLALFVLLRWGPPLLDRMTKASVQHVEAEDRKGEKVTDAFIDQVQRGEKEREGFRQERLQLLTVQDAFRLQLAQFEGVQVASNASIAEINQLVKEIKAIVYDFDKRMVLYLKSQEKNSQ